MENEIKMKHNGFEWLSQGFDNEHLILNEQSVRNCFLNLLPNTNLYLVKNNLYVHPEFGNILSPDDDPSVPLTLSSFSFKNEAEFVSRLQNVKNIYLKAIYSNKSFTTVSLDDACWTEVVMACYTPSKKKNVTFTIDSEIISKFSKICDKMAINKSKFIENHIKDFIEINS